MKKLLLLLALSLFFGSSVFAQDLDKTPTITVTGIADVMIAPDEVIFSLDFTKVDKDLQVAKRLNDESVAKILELTKRFNILPRNVKTDSISVEMKYQSIRDAKAKIYDEDGDEIGRKIFKGYEVSKTVTIRLTDLSRFEEFFGETLKTGITEVNSVTFETSKLRESKDKARDMAMKAAKEKATAMAASIGQDIGKAVKITEGAMTDQFFRTGSLNSNNNLPFELDGTTTKIVSENVATFAPGAIKISAQVTVSFLLN